MASNTPQSVDEQNSNAMRLETWVSALVFSVVLGYWLYTVLHRLNYPYDLEWMEGGMLIHAWRIQQDLGIYVEPSSDFIPYIYPPLYPTILAWMSELWSLDYWMGRGVSIVGSLLATSAVIVGVRNEVKTWSVAWLSGALWLSTYEDAGTFLDLTRADGLMMGLLSWSLVLVRFDRLKLSGVLLWLAFLAKHNAAIVGLPVALWLWREKGVRSAWTFGLFAAVPALASIGWLQLQTEGLFLTYLLDVPAHHPIVAHRLFWLSELEMATSVALPLLLWVGMMGKRLWSQSLVRSLLWSIGVFAFLLMTRLDMTVYPKLFGSHKIGQVPFAVGVWLLMLCAVLRPSKWRTLFAHHVEHTRGSSFWLWMTVVMVSFSALMRGHHGGFTNVLMPGLWVLSIVVPLALCNQIKRRAFVLIAIALQAIIGLWTADDLIPTQEDRMAGDALVAELQTRPGPIFAPHSPWLPVQAGHPPTAHLIALWDIDHEGGPLVDSVESIKADIQNHRWGTIVSADKRLGFGLPRYYEYHQSIRPKGRTFLPKVGWKVRPSYVYRPKK